MLWLKVFYFIVVICWFVVIFYLFCLFVYYVMVEDQISCDCFKIMECKFYWGIMNLFMIVILVLGIWMLVLNWDYYKIQGWLYVKIILVVLLIGYYYVCLVYLK